MALSKSLRDRIDRYLAKTQDMPRTIDPQDSGGSFRYITQNGAIVFDPKQRAELFELIEFIRTKVAKQEWSFAKVQNDVLEAITVARESTNREMDKEYRRQAISQIETALDKPCIEWETYFPIIGIHEDCLPIDVGRTSFYRPSDSLSAKLVCADGAPCDVQLPEGVSVSSCRRDSRKQIDEEFGNTPWGCVKVMAFEGDYSGAENAGLEEIRRTLDVVNFYADLWRPINYLARASLASEPDQTVLAYITRPVGREVLGGPGTRSVGQMDDVWLYPADSVPAKEYGFDRVTKILKKHDNDRTEIDHRLLAAMRWAGRATIARRRDEAFLLFMMALEALIMGTKHVDAITYRIPIRISQLAEPEVDKRKLIAEIRELYNLRSRLVHSGIAGISEYSVERARTITKEITIILLRKEPFVNMTKNEDLDQWFEDQIAGHSVTDEANE